MKNYTQVYVKNSIEAANTYCEAFGAEITRAFPNASGTAWEHCELSVNGQFRTPRHIIRMMVEMMEPKADEVICEIKFPYLIQQNETQIAA